MASLARAVRPDSDGQHRVALPVGEAATIGRADATGGDKFISRKHVLLRAAGRPWCGAVLVRCLSKNPVVVWSGPTENSRVTLGHCAEATVDCRAGGRLILLSGGASGGTREATQHTFMFCCEEPVLQEAAVEATFTAAEVHAVVPTSDRAPKRHRGATGGRAAVPTAALGAALGAAANQPLQAATAGSCKQRLWEELSAAQQQATQAIGYSQQSWDAGEWWVGGPDWDELDEDEHRAALLLGFNRQRWAFEMLGQEAAAQGTLVPDVPMVEEQQAHSPPGPAAISLAGPAAVAIDLYAETGGSCKHMLWSELSTAQQQATHAIGYSQQSWDAGEWWAGGPDWDELDEDEHEAALQLGFARQTWAFEMLGEVEVEVEAESAASTGEKASGGDEQEQDPRSQLELAERALFVKRELEVKRKLLDRRKAELHERAKALKAAEAAAHAERMVAAAASAARAAAAAEEAAAARQAAVANYSQHNAFQNIYGRSVFQNGKMHNLAPPAAAMQESDDEEEGRGAPIHWQSLLFCHLLSPGTNFKWNQVRRQVVQAN